jgi:proline iminopeptidase
MAASTKSYLKRTAALKQQLAPAMLAKLNALEAKQDYDSPEYGQIMMEELYPKMLCRTNPWPEPVTRVFRHANLKIYEQIQGKSEFVVTGSMKDWDLWNRLHEIKTKTLTIGAKYDEMDPEDMKKMATLMPSATSFICENGSHLCMYDDQAAYFGSLLKFLRTV